ncbi:MAG: AraC family transcriptional regulator [Pseudomonadota bacterium]
MPSLPIPLVGALILCFLLARMWFVEGNRGPLAGLLALCAVQSLIISLVQHYGLSLMFPLQVLMATVIPPAAWLCFQVTAVRSFGQLDLVHLAPPILGIMGLFWVPVLLDLLIPALFLGYGAAILWHVSKGSDGLPRLRLENGETPGRIWLIIGAALMLSGLSDVLIAVAQAAGAPQYRPWIITVFSSGMLLVVGGLSLSDALGAETHEADIAAPPTVGAEEVDIMARLDALMSEQRPYLNPDLTLAQLARRMRVPVKQLSGAINRVTGENVSRYINAARVAAAQVALRRGESVTNAMLSSGFNTKSNFNREFLRVCGQSPSAWVQAQGSSQGD